MISYPSFTRNDTWDQTWWIHNRGSFLQTRSCSTLESLIANIEFFCSRHSCIILIKTSCYNNLEEAPSRCSLSVVQAPRSIHVLLFLTRRCTFAKWSFTCLELVASSINLQRGSLISLCLRDGPAMTLRRTDPCRLVISFNPRNVVPRGMFVFLVNHASFLAKCVAFPMKCVVRLISCDFASCLSIRKSLQVSQSSLLSYVVPFGTRWFTISIESPLALGVCSEFKFVRLLGQDSALKSTFETLSQTRAPDKTHVTFSLEVLELDQAF